MVDYLVFFIIRFRETKPAMTKEKLIEIIQRLLKTEIDQSFLLQLKETELETLLVCIRSEVER